MTLRYEAWWWIFTPKNVGGPPMVSASWWIQYEKSFQFLWQLTQSSRWGFVLAIWVNSGGTFSIMSNRLLLSSYFPFTKVNETYFPITVLLPFGRNRVHYVFWSFYFLYKIGESCYFFDSDISNFVVWLVTHFPLIFKKPSF